MLRIEQYRDSLVNIYNRFDGFFSRASVKKICFGVILITSFLLIYILNYLHPLFGDDWMYSMLPDGHIRIQNLGDIFYTQYEHYFTWGGRSVVHVIAQILLWVGTTWGDLLNSIAYIVLTLVIYTIANQGNKIRPSLLLGINLLIWFFQPAFGSTILWITGSANYLWGTLIILCFLVPYIKILNNPKEGNSILKAILMFLFGIIAGWTNENMAVAFIFMIAVFCLYYLKRHKYIPSWMISGFVGSIIGCVFMLAAPGNYARIAMVASGDLATQSVFIKYLHQFVTALASYYYYALSATFIYFVVVALCVDDQRTLKCKTKFFISITFFVGALIATLSMSASPIFPGRASFGINTFLFVAIGVLYANLDFSKRLIRCVSTIVLIFGMLYLGADYFREYKNLKELHLHLDKRIEFVNAERNNGITNIVLDDRIAPDSRFIHYYELTPDSANWHNRIFSNYYQIESTIIK